MEQIPEHLNTPEHLTFHKETGCLLLDINQDIFSSERNILEGIASEYGLVPKEDLHITVIGNQNGQKIMSILNKKPEHEKDALLEEMHVVAEQTDWSFSLLPTDVYRVEKGYAYKDPETKEPKKEHRIAIVQAVSVPGVDSFFKKLNDMLGTEMAPQPMHVTLYTGGTDPERSKKGIGVNSIEEFFALRPAQILV
ncbi:MAG: hypothetical protein HGB03_00285 [Candidatus Yonathbacteria bacterium]|nr:hypothetical protein [Candidatus Yonathbacteria bacterium]NTW48116.1 hypothetical protein [Candidatus Yonathbacteria bacterium]